jgi:ATP-dependent DNA helicase RecG
MLKFENENVEFKQEYVPEIRKEVIAFTNAEGGVILVGVRKDGVVVGVDKPDEVMQQITNSLKDAIAPDVMPFVSVNTVELEGLQVVQIDVSTGTNRPYYLREKGLKPSGVYVRKGSSSQPMTDDGIREMIVRNSGKSYESSRSINQSLTFETLSGEMKKRSIDFGNAQMRTLKLIGEDGLYTNLGYLLSDQCEITTKVALFQGTDKAVFRDRKEFTGSILKQLEDVYQFIDLNNKTKATFSGLDRVDKKDYPEEAVREALLNCTVHRDYSFSGSNLINIYDDRMEYVSLGGLVPGLELKSIFLGVSLSRNPNLAAVFYRMRLIESYGTGITKIQRMYNGFMKQPEFETAQGAFRVTLPNCNETGEVSTEKVAEQTKATEIGLDIEKQKKIIVEYAIENGQVTRKEVEELLDAGTTKAFRLLRELCDEGRLAAEGKGKLSRYLPK